ncbi:MAG: single-stranded DNA-binding protein [Prevotellaceae bacterium]|jgi:single-strand DNA-binding protein|nr:single-stranded DNA-binding protein [Prevotellaceae bacterium]
MSFNKVLIIGNVGKDPEVRHLESGVAVVTLLVATNERVKDKYGEWREQTEWHNVVLWRKNQAEIVEKYVKKGTQVFIEGKLRTRTWEDQNGVRRSATEIVADTLRLLGRKGDYNSSFPQQGQYESKPAIVSIASEPEVDDLPF